MLAHMVNRVDVGSVLSRAFAIYKDQAAVLLPVAFGLFLIVGVLQGLLGGFLVLLATVASLIASTLYTGMVVKLVDDVRDGRRDNSAGDLLGSAAPVIVPLILAGLVVGLLVVIGFILLVVPGLILLTIFAVVAPVIVIERAGVFEAMGRSRALVKGNGWNVFGVIIVAFLIAFVVSARPGRHRRRHRRRGGPHHLQRDRQHPDGAHRGAGGRGPVLHAARRHVRARAGRRRGRDAGHLGHASAASPAPAGLRRAAWRTSSHPRSSGRSSTRWPCAWGSAARRRWWSPAASAAASRCCR